MGSVEKHSAAMLAVFQDAINEVDEISSNAQIKDVGVTSVF
jgi:hypothetical protein